MREAELERHARALDEIVGSHDAFRQVYRHKPVEFVKRCITWADGKGLAPYQTEILNALIRERRVAIRSPHGAGKTTAVAWAVLWFSLTRDEDTDWKVVCTASAWRQLAHYLMPEIHLWAKKLRWDVIGRTPFTSDELMTLRLKLGTGEAFAVASDDPAYIEGAHASSLLYAFDEAKAIPDKTFDAAEGAFSGAGEDTGGEAYALAISTPGPAAGRFFDIHTRKPGYEEWWVRHVTIDEAIAAGRISREWADARKKQWGETNPVYINRVLGEFAEGEDALIPLYLVEAANERWQEWADEGKPLAVDQDTKQVIPMDVVGVDVARFGDDLTVLALRYGDMITEIRHYAKEDTMKTTGRVRFALRKGGKAVVDVIGVGAGVVDRLREQKQKVQPFNAGAKAKWKDRSGELEFLNLRAAAWWNLREMLEDGDIALPPDDMLTGDLTAPMWEPTSGGKIKVEAKEKIKGRLGRSTNYGDAVVMAFWKHTGVFFAIY